MSARKEHVIARRWQEGGFHVRRYIRCRCGQKFTHYNAGKLTEMFKEHQKEKGNT